MEDSLGSRIKEAREGVKLKRTQLAEKLEKSVSAISQYEKGTISPKINELMRIAEICKVDKLWLLEGRDTVLTNNIANMQSSIPDELLAQIKEEIKKEYEEKISQYEKERVEREKQLNSLVETVNNLAKLVKYKVAEVFAVVYEICYSITNSVTMQTY